MLIVYVSDQTRFVYEIRQTFSDWSLRNLLGGLTLPQTQLWSDHYLESTWSLVTPALLYEHFEVVTLQGNCSKTI